MNIYADRAIENPPAKSAIIEGMIIDNQTGEVLAGASVNIEGTDIKTYTDFDGSFKINDLRPGNYNLVVSYISYKKSLVEINNLKAGTKESVNIHLQVSE